MNAIRRHQKAKWQNRRFWRHRWLSATCVKGTAEGSKWAAWWEQNHNCSCMMCRHRTRKVWGNGRNGKSIQELRLIDAD